MYHVFGFQRHQQACCPHGSCQLHVEPWRLLDGGCHPEVVWPCRFDEDFELLVHEPDYQAVTFVLFDANTISKDEEIGRMTLPIKDLPPGETKDLWLELGPAADDRLNNPLQMGFTVSLAFCAMCAGMPGIYIHCLSSAGGACLLFADSKRKFHERVSELDPFAALHLHIACPGWVLI